jgi:branched-chain amino acid transport system ATP-binding protein
MGLAPIVVQQLYEIVAQVAREGISILVVEQFAQAVLGIADLAAIMVNGTVTQAGTPAEMQSVLSDAYLGG